MLGGTVISMANERIAVRTSELATTVRPDLRRIADELTQKGAPHSGAHVRQVTSRICDLVAGHVNAVWIAIREAVTQNGIADRAGVWYPWRVRIKGRPKRAPSDGGTAQGRLRDPRRRFLPSSSNGRRPP